MIEVRDLVVGYGPTQVLNGIDLTVGTGSVVAVLGPNGAGKSTLLRTVSGLLRPRSGSIHLGDTDVTATSASARTRQGLALVPEGRRLFGSLTVEQNLLIGGYARRDHRALKSEVREFLDRWPVIGRRRDGAAGNLSGGEQQIVALGRALMSRPQMLLLDEPSLGLAPILVNEIYRLIAEIAATGMTILLVEQNPTQALKVAETVNVLVGGQIVASTPSTETTPEQVVGHFFTGSETGPGATEEH
ncbi:MAG TPA: ABC transporter ATP-binding protein [Pseudolysinimonas sp.]|nr:ABC transporter ATP-binding protein [Pseudolysinimonas sp.]